MNKIIAAFTLALCITVLMASYSDSVQADLQNNLVRLHIIANSDTDADQAVKLKVRDAVLKRAMELSENGSDGIIQNLNEIEKTAQNVLYENGFNYEAKAQYGKFAFPEKSYKSITLPAGDYYGVRIVLGEGIGQNWWCVMYPPLCFNENNEVKLSEKSESLLRENLDENTYDIITEKNGEIVVKFKVVEIFQELKQILLQKGV